MKLLGIDYGEKRVGVAYTEGKLATPLTEYSLSEAVVRIQKLRETIPFERCVIGLPSGYLEAKVKHFGQQLQLNGLEVVYWDETLSSHSARLLLSDTHTRKKRKQQEHKTAAAVILQAYLDEGIG